MALALDEKRHQPNLDLDTQGRRGALTRRANALPFFILPSPEFLACHTTQSLQQVASQPYSPAHLAFAQSPGKLVFIPLGQPP